VYLYVWLHYFLSRRGALIWSPLPTKDRLQRFINSTKSPLVPATSL
jgi:hypothetical protein